MTAEEALDWVLSWSSRWSAETDASWAIADSGDLVGRVGFRDLDLVNGSGEVAYWVVPTSRGRNIAARAFLVAAVLWVEVMGL